MEGIILAGGLGTRLRSVVNDIPKPMCLVNSKPFLTYLLDYLNLYNFKKIILAVGYKGNIIKEYFGNSYKNIKIVYSDEETPLGTGGAIKKALKKSDKNEVFIFNGDTFFECNLNNMLDIHKKSICHITIAVKTMYSYNRYGSVNVKNNKIIKFNEKKKREKGIINGGIYIVNKEIFDDINLVKFSFEKDILESNNYSMYAYESKGYFIDIGIPDDYYRAQEELFSGR